MAYANKLPKPVIQLLRWFNAGCFLFTLVACIDIFILPYKTFQEKIIKRQEIYHTGRSKYSSRSHTTQLDNVILFTENNRYAYHKVQRFDPREADSARLVTTILFNIVKTAHVKADGVERELKQGAGMFGTFIFIPISFGLIAAFGVMMWNNNEQLLNAAVTNLMLIVIQLWVLGYF